MLFQESKGHSDASTRNADAIKSSVNTYHPSIVLTEVVFFRSQLAKKLFAEIQIT